MSSFFVRLVPHLFCMVVVLSCFVPVRSWTSLYDVLLLSFFRQSSLFWHHFPYPVFLCLFHAFLDFLFNCSVLCHRSLYLLLFLFLSFLRLAQRSRMSVVTQGFLTGRYLQRISLAVSVTAVLKVSVNISMSMSESRMESAANFLSLLGRSLQPREVCWYGNMYFMLC